MEKSLRHCFRQQIKLYNASNHNEEKNSINKPNHKIRRKNLKAQILQDIKHTRARVEEIIERENIWTVPNFLCLGRIITSPFLGYLILSQEYQVSHTIGEPK